MRDGTRRERIGVNNELYTFESADGSTSLG